MTTEFSAADFERVYKRLLSGPAYLAHPSSEADAVEYERIILAALCLASKPPLPEGEDGRDDETADRVIMMLAKIVGAKDWQPQNGTEDWDGDVSATLMDVLKHAGLYDDENGRWAKLAALPEGEPVAWRWRYAGRDWWYLSEDDPADSLASRHSPETEIEVQPLYVSPPSAAKAERADE